MLLYVAALCWLDFPPSLPPPSPPPLCPSGLSVVIWALSWWGGGGRGGQSGVVGIFSGHHQWGRTVETWRAHRRRGDTAAWWVTFEERDGSDWTAGTLLLVVVVWTGSCRWKNCSRAFFSLHRTLSFVPLYNQSTCWKKKEQLSVFSPPPPPLLGIYQWPYPCTRYFYPARYRPSPKIFLGDFKCARCLAAGQTKRPSRGCTTCLQKAHSAHCFNQCWWLLLRQRSQRGTTSGPQVLEFWYRAATNGCFCYWLINWLFSISHDCRLYFRNLFWTFVSACN